MTKEPKETIDKFALPRVLKAIKQAVPIPKRVRFYWLNQLIQPTDWYCRHRF